MRISSVILISFFFILLLFSVTTYINYKQSELVDENSEKFATSSIIVRHCHRFQRNFLTMVSGLRGYLLTNETSFIQSYDSAIRENEDILGELSLLIPPESGQKMLLADIRALNQRWLMEFAAPLLEAKKLTDTSDSSRIAFSALYRKKLVDGMDKTIQKNLQQKFSAFTNYEYGARDRQKERLTASVRNTKSASFYLTIISIVAGICIAMFISYRLSSRVIKMVNMANAIAEGDYTVHINENENSELGQLAKALNRMARILDENFTLLKRQKGELDQFAHIVSHDLRAPLRGIDNVVTWIEEDHSIDLPQRVVEYLSLIKGRVARAENLIKGILMYARVGKEGREREVVDVGALLKEVLEDTPRRPGIEVLVQPDMPVLFTERVPLLQIFINLIHNAVKYHDKDTGKVKVYHQLNGEFYEFFVEDDGPGIAAQYHTKIFQIFQTLVERDRFESTGVGLSIVKKILDDRKLSIDLRSEPGKGSVFSFRWPKNEFYETSY